MPAPKNKLKSAILSGKLQIGIWLGLASSSVAEMAGSAGFDWCLIDGEHGPNDLSRIEEQLRAFEGQPTSAIVRVPQSDDWILKQVLDLGAQSVLVPMVETAEQASDIVAACKYAPQGRRGVGYALARASRYNAISDYAATANEEVCVIVQVETLTAMNNIPKIAKVKGIDCIFIGPADLSADMGYLTQPDHPDVLKVIEQGMKDIAAAGVAAGTIAFLEIEQKRFIEQGGTFLGITADVVLLQSELQHKILTAQKL